MNGCIRQDRKQLENLVVRILIIKYINNISSGKPLKPVWSSVSATHVGL